tara:strand:+ start:2071 stop:2400 length:330 start_codon:yes stop_codon:yes gene_type:complete
LNKKELEILIRKKINLISIEIQELKLLTIPIEPENAIGRISRMDAINNKSINDRMLRKAKEKLKKLNLALSRINEKEFGMCINCNKLINENRLMLMPEVVRCVKCAQIN